MQVYETVTCHIDTRDINIENCKQIVPIILWVWLMTTLPRQGPVQEIIISKLSMQIGWLW